MRGRNERNILGTRRQNSRKRSPCCLDRKSTRLNSSHRQISYAVFCLKKKKTPRGRELALISVRTLAAADRRFLVVAGQRIDSSFLRGLVFSEDTRLLLWQPSRSGGELDDAQGPVSMPAELKPMLEESLREKTDLKRSVRLDNSDISYMAHAIPRIGRDSKQPLAILV